MTTKHQNWNAAQYAENARFVSELGMPVVDLLAPEPGERILDLGCGDGALTIKLKELGCTVVGIDASADMVAAAQRLGIDAHVGDAEQLIFDQEFDAVFSNAALHWMPAADEVVAGVWRALRPTGRFVGEFGGFGNTATVAAAVNQALDNRGFEHSHPWFFPEPDNYQRILESHGFTVRHMELFPRLTPLPGEISAWLETFYRRFLGAISVADWPAFLAEVCALLEPDLRDDSGTWHVDYVRLRFSAVKAVS